MQTQCVAGNFIRIKHVQWAVQIVSEPVGHIHKERNRAHPNSLKLLLQPIRARAVFHTFNHTAKEHRCLIHSISVDGHGNGVSKRRRNGFDCIVDQRAQTTRCQITRHTAHAQCVRAVWRNRDFDHRVNLRRVMFSQIISKRLTNLTRGQLNNTVVLVGQFQLFFGCHHAKRFNAANFAHRNGDIEPRNISTRLSHNDSDPLARIRRTTNDLRGAFACLNSTNPQLVGVRMLFRRRHFTDHKIRQFRRRVFNALNLKPEVSERICNLIHGRSRVEVGFEPRESEFHRLRPANKCWAGFSGPCPIGKGG